MLEEKLKTLRQVPLIAYLESRGIKPIKTKVDQGEMFFYFLDTPELAEEQRKYFSGQASVEPVWFNNTLHRIRQLIQSTPGTRRRVV